MRRVLLVVLFVSACPLPHAEAVPHFARRYGVQCTHCHVMPPKLNQTGEDFFARGYRLDASEPKSTFPLSLWLRALGLASFNRISFENEYVPVKWASVGIRRDQVSRQRHATVFHLNFQASLKQHTFRLVIERREQPGNRATVAELSLVL